MMPVHHFHSVSYSLPYITSKPVDRYSGTQAVQHVPITEVVAACDDRLQALWSADQIPRMAVRWPAQRMEVTRSKTCRSFSRSSLWLHACRRPCITVEQRKHWQLTWYLTSFLIGSGRKYFSWRKICRAPFAGEAQLGVVQPQGRNLLALSLSCTEVAPGKTVQHIHGEHQLHLFRHHQPVAA